MELKRTVLVWAIMLGFAVTAQAQLSNGKLGAGVLLGGSKLQGDIEQSGAGLTGGLLLTYSFNPKFSLSATGTYGKMTSGVDAIHTRLLSTAIVGNYYLLPEMPINPFLSFGLSTFQYEATGSRDEALYKPDGSVYKGWEQALQMGLGFELSATKLWTVKTMVNYNFSQGDELDAVDGGSNDGFFKGMVGVIRYFGDEDGWQEDGGRTEAWPQLKRELPVEQVEQAEKPMSRREPAPAPQASMGAGIEFQAGTAVLLESSKARLDEVYEFMVANPGETVELLGKSSDQQGSVNYQLVVARARSIKAYLVSKGIAPSRILIHGK